MQRLNVLAVAMLFLVGISSSAFAGSPSDKIGCCFGTSGCDSCIGFCGSRGCEPTWLVTMDALFLDRDKPSSGILAFNTVNPSQNINADNLNFGNHTGFDVSLARRLGSKSQLELRYFGIDGWDAFTGTATTPNDLLRFNAAVPVFVAAGDGIVSGYESELHNAEINVGRQIRDCLGLSLGFRYVEMNERGATSLTNAAIPFSYLVRTSNKLYGAQVGGHALLWRHDCFSLEATGKAGIYGNHSDHGALTATNVATLTAVGSDDRVAFVGELGFTGAAYVTECVSVRGGYNLLWLDGVAVATDQLAASDFNTGVGYNGSGDIFYHGAFIGLALSY